MTKHTFQAQTRFWRLRHNILAAAREHPDWTTEQILAELSALGWTNQDITLRDFVEMVLQQAPGSAIWN